MKRGSDCAPEHYGCAWRVERALSAREGVGRAEVNFARRLARVEFEPGTIGLGAILGAVRATGYRAEPYRPSTEEAQLEAELRTRARNSR